MLKRFSIAVIAVLACLAPAHAQQVLGAARIESNGTVRLPGGPLLGTMSGSTFTAKPDALTVGQTNGFTLPYARSVSGAATRSLLQKLGDLPLTPQDVGATCNGTAADDAALNGLVGFLSEISITSGTCRITANATWPKNKTIRIAPGAMISTDAGKILTIKSIIEAPNRQIFTGAGKVQGMTLNRPEWWGAVSTAGNTYDSKAAIQAAVDSAAASYSAGEPQNFSDGGKPYVEFSTGFYRVCSPIDVYPTSTVVVAWRGRGVLNSGSRIDACPTFTGGNLLNIRAPAAGNPPAFELDIEGIQFTDYSRRTTACIRFNPDGAGYGFNNGSTKPASLKNIVTQGCPIGLDIDNTLQLEVNRFTYVGIGSTGNTGVRLTATGASAATGTITFNELQVTPCPTLSAANCSNTFGMIARADGGGVFNGAGVASIKIQGNSIFWASNSSIDALASNGGVMGDWWIGEGTQFDGVGCAYVRFIADGSLSRVNNIHVNHAYHTAVLNTGCTAHVFAGANGGQLTNIFDTNSQFVLGGAAGSAIYVNATTGFTVSGNVIGADSNGVGAIQIIGSKAGTVSSNTVTSGYGGTPYAYSAFVDATSSYVAVTGNVAMGTSQTGVNGVNVAATTKGLATGNVGP